jgi:hypothetical protein
MKSSFCQDGGCVEVEIDVNGYVIVTSASNSPYEAFFTREEWEDFIKGAKAGEFDWDKIPQEAPPLRGEKRNPMLMSRRELDESV